MSFMIVFYWVCFLVFMCEVALKMDTAAWPTKVIWCALLAVFIYGYNIAIKKGNPRV